MDIRTFWKPRAGTNLQRFTKSGETATEVILTNAPTAITEPGTAFSADRMNSIENRISDNQIDIQAIKSGGFWISSIIQSGFSTLRGMGFDYDGSVFVCSAGDQKIYKQPNGDGSFVDEGYTSRAYRDICFTENGDAYATTFTGDVFRKLSSETDFTLFDTILGASNLDSIISFNGEIYVSDNGTGGIIYKLDSGNFVAVSGWPASEFSKLCENQTEYIIGINNSSDIIRLNIDGTYSTIYSGTVVSASISSSGDIYIIEGGYLKKSIDEGITFSNVIATSATKIDIGRDGKIYLYDASTISRLSYNTTSITSTDQNIYVCRSSETGYTSGDYATINDALEYARTIQMQCGKYIYVNVRDNHVLNYQVIIENCDLSYVVIQRVAASMTAFNVNPSGFVVYPGTSIYALFYVKNSRSPLFNMLFNLQKATYSAQAYRGLHAEFSHINGASGAGFQNCAGAGVIGVSESVISWTGIRSTGNTLQGIGLFGCRAYINSATLTGNAQPAITVEQSSMVYANAITATTTTAGTATCRAAEGSFLNISDAVLTGTTSTTPIQCATGSIIHARNTTATTNITVNSTPIAAGIIMR